jgi:hypothetical protein
MKCFEIKNFQDVQRMNPTAGNEYFVEMICQRPTGFGIGSYRNIKRRYLIDSFIFSSDVEKIYFLFFTKDTDIGFNLRSKDIILNEYKNGLSSAIYIINNLNHISTFGNCHEYAMDKL